MTHEDPLRAELAALLPAPGDPQLPVARRDALEHHLMRELTAEPAPRPAYRRRLAIIAVPVALTAVAVTATVVAGTDGPAGTPPATAAGTVDLLSAAAAAAPAPAPGADQYVYVRSVVRTLALELSGEAGMPDGGVYEREVWLAPDGADGRLIDALTPDDGVALEDIGIPLEFGPYSAESPEYRDSDGPYPASLVMPSYDWLRSLPTDPADLLEQVYDSPAVQVVDDPDQMAFSQMGDILSRGLVPSDLAAAFVEAAGRIPGVEVRTGVTDVEGREGIALVRTDDEARRRVEWVFDAADHTYLGHQEVTVQEEHGVAAGTVVNGFAVLDRTVVDAVGERPSGTR
jgi:hypothetical protein